MHEDATRLFQDGALAVLVAEDDRELRELIAWALRGDGHDVVEARDGVELLQLMGWHLPGGEGRNAARRFALVITDNRMPTVDGLDALAALRRSGDTTPVILITAFGDEATRRKASALDAEVLDKPVDLDDLIGLARKALRSSSEASS